MKIAILGAGSVGGTLGNRFRAAGHQIFFGVLDPRDEKYRKLLAEMNSSVQVSTVAEAARNAEFILLAVPYEAVPDALRHCGEIKGKILIDATNPLRLENGSLKLSLGYDTSGAEEIAKLAAGAKVVKCFNQTGFGNMAEPRYESQPSVMFVCGDDSRANETVRGLAETIGFETIDAGKLEVARLLEPLAMLWIHLAFNTPLRRDFAFALLRRS